MISFLDKPIWIWGFFFIVVTTLLAFDLGVLHRHTREIGAKESIIFTLFYIFISLLFGLWIGFELGAQAAQEFFTGYLVEKTLSMDNIFVISLIFSYFAIPRGEQYRVLFFGILGVILLRAILITLGSTIIHHFAWALYVFAVFLIVTGFKMLFMKETVPDIEHNIIFRGIKKLFRVTPTLHGQKFFVRLPDPKRHNKKVIWCTPLFLTLLMIESADIIFAFDSIPAIFLITTDVFIIYTSNIFAILGLRALYFALSAMIQQFLYLKHALAAVLIFIGSKVFIADLLGLEKFPPSISLFVTVMLLGIGILYSLYHMRKSRNR